jgi:hypothetical protein
MYPWKGDTKPTTTPVTDKPGVSAAKPNPTTMSATPHRPATTSSSKPASTKSSRKK